MPKNVWNIFGLLLNHMTAYTVMRCRFSSYSLFSVDDIEKPRHLYTRASLVSYRSLVKQISGRPVPPEIRAWTVSALLHHLRWPLDHVVSSSCANSPSAYA
jgi:hypothetical protein